MPERSVTPEDAVIGSPRDYCMILEVRNQVVSGGSDPSIQAAQSYSWLWRGSPVSRYSMSIPNRITKLAPVTKTVLLSFDIDRHCWSLAMRTWRNFSGLSHRTTVD
jgi:hypothetical protein